MSQLLYESLIEKWRDFLSKEFYPYLGEMTEDDVSDQYDDLVDDFCMQYGYSEKTRNFAFYGRWYDTFADDFYKEMDKKGVKITHDQEGGGRVKQEANPK